MERAVFIVVFGAIWLYCPYLEFSYRVVQTFFLKNSYEYVNIYYNHMLCAIFNSLIYNTYNNNNTCKFSCWIDGMHVLRLLCCYLFVNLNEIQDIISHNLYIFNKCRIFVCGICLICLTVVLFFWIVIVALFALIDFVFIL